MTEDDIRRVVHQVLQDERERNADQMDAVVFKTISTILISFGINDDDRKEMQADFAHLRRWRKSVEQVNRTGMITIVGIIVTGLTGAIWLGFKTILGK
jgi:hypothetical protein